MRTLLHASVVPLAFVLLAVGLMSIDLETSSARVPATAPADPRFAEYWYAGLAELSRYELEQARYGEIHPGHALLIFVTEDFHSEKHVKSEGRDPKAADLTSVLKMNFTKKFDTGLYPYSILASVFTPVDAARHPRTLKTTHSVQEWCGHTWLQLDLRKARYQVEGRSYFEAEGDQQFTLEAAWLEDETWTRIRLDPASLPKGKFRAIPGGEQHRLLHRPLAVIDAEGTLASDGALSVYTIRYPTAGRTLAIRFQAEFPHRIEGWEETIDGARGGRAPLTTRATRTHTERLAYWNHNSTADAPLRKKLGL